MLRNTREEHRVSEQRISTIKENLADFLTLSRAVISLIILSFSFMGKEAYVAVVILALTGAATDVFDGRAARRYLGKDREGKLGRYDLAVDTLFALCILAYFSLSGIVIPMLLAFPWIVLAIISAFLWKFKAKVLNIFEIPTILALYAIAGIYDLRLFLVVIVPITLVGVIYNWHRMCYVIRVKIPRDFAE